MAISYPDVLKLAGEPRPVAWTDRDTILYALGVGFGSDPMDPADLPFVYEENLVAVPTFAAALMMSTDQALRDVIGIDLNKVVHGSHRMQWLRPLPPVGRGTLRSRVVDVLDKGADKGAIVVTETELTEDGNPEPLAIATLTRFARGDGGFGGPSSGGAEPHRTPSRDPDVSVDVPTLPSQALVYRLSGDRNPLHADPAFAARAGFSRPILHGLCTFGIACRAVLRTYAESDPARLRSQEARFSAPVIPGETLAVDLWRDGEAVSFEARVKERGVKVMTSGKVELTAA